MALQGSSPPCEKRHRAAIRNWRNTFQHGRHERAGTTQAGATTETTQGGCASRSMRSCSPGAKDPPPRGITARLGPRPRPTARARRRGRKGGSPRWVVPALQRPPPPLRHLPRPPSSTAPRRRRRRDDPRKRIRATGSDTNDCCAPSTTRCNARGLT